MNNKMTDLHTLAEEAVPAQTCDPGICKGYSRASIVSWVEGALTELQEQHEAELTALAQIGAARQLVIEELKSKQAVTMAEALERAMTAVDKHRDNVLSALRSLSPDAGATRSRCSVSFEHPPHDFCDGNPGAKSLPNVGGKVLVPREPTLDMLQAALEWNRSEKPHNVVIAREYHVATQMWRVMLAAAEGKP